MPEQLEKKLRAEAIRRRMGKTRAGAFVYGTMRKTGWVPSTQATSAQVSKEKESHGH